MKIACSAQKAPRLVTVYAIKPPWIAAQLRKTALTGALFPAREAGVEKRLAQRGVLLILRGLDRCKKKNEKKNIEKRMNEREVS